MGSDHGELFFEAKESLLPYVDSDLPFPLAFLPMAWIPPPNTLRISFRGDLPFLLFSPEGDSE